MKKNIIMSVLLAAVIVVIIFVVTLRPEGGVVVPPEQGSQSPADAPITITTQTIKEENFSGTRPAIAGSGMLADAARKYVQESIDAFAATANEEVPDRKKEFGADAPPAHYTIDTAANYIKGKTTESIVIDQYVYTGGANGNSLYKVFTASRTDGYIIPITDVIAADKQHAFVSFVQKELSAWRPEGSKDPVVFAEEIKDLTISSFDDWSLDDKNFTIYFDKYAIGPGALGAVAFPLPLSKVQSFIVPSVQ